MADSLKYSLHHYGTQHELQRLGVWELASATRGQYWIVYIHGGAWRDPRVTHEAFAPSISHILGESESQSPSPSSADSLTSPANANAIAGFASIDYRLSPHPEFPQDAETTPPARYRGAVHPHHIDDVSSALLYLQRQFGFGRKYVLVGHSAGACLAFQLIAGSPSSSLSSSSPSTSTTMENPMGTGTGRDYPVLPAAIVPLEGLYDFTGINQRYDGAYAPFFRGAFGDEEKAWDEAAPIKFAGNYADKFAAAAAATSASGNGNGDENGDKSGGLIVLGWSKEDTLVDEPEADNMARRLRDIDGFVDEGVDEDDGGGNNKTGIETGVGRLVFLKDLHGDHDDIWRDGKDVARLVWIALRKLGVST